MLWITSSLREGLRAAIRARPEPKTLLQAMAEC